MSNQRFIGVLIGVIYILFLLSINASDLKLPSFITSNRLGITLIVFLYFFIFVLNKRKIEFTKKSLVYSALFFIIAVWGLISLLISPYSLETSLVPIVTWILIGISTLLLNNIFIHIDRKTINFFLSFIIIAGSIIVIIYFLWGYIKVGNFRDNYLWTRALNETSNGQSRIMNGLLVINILNVLVVFRVIKKVKTLYLISFFTLSIFILFVIVNGSRQTLLAILVAIILTFLINLLFNEKGGIKSSITRIITVIASLGVIITLIKYINLYDWLKHRFLDDTMAFGDSDQSRLQIIKEALAYTAEYPFFGVGPGAFINISSVGIFTHNGYANILVHYGIIPTLLLVILIIWSLKIGFKELKMSNKINDYTFRGIYLFGIINVIVFSTTSFMFNDLMNEYFFWILVVMLLSLPNNKYYERNESN